MSINNDTIYSVAQLGLSGGPLVLRVPDVAGRYYVLQFIDAWTNNFAFVGRRAAGTTAGKYLLVPPGWPGMRRPRSWTAATRSRPSPGRSSRPGLQAGRDFRLAGTSGRSGLQAGQAG